MKVKNVTRIDEVDRIVLDLHLIRANNEEVPLKAYAALLEELAIALHLLPDSVL